MSSSETIRVVLADDNQLLRMGLRALFSEEPDVELVAEAQNGAEAVTLCLERRPDVLVVDLRMPVLDGIAVIQNLSARGSATRCLVLSHHDGDEKVYQAMRAGALGYVTKDVPPRDILHAVRAVARGERHLPGALAAKLAARASQDGLTTRERQVLEQVAHGLSNRAIGEKLGIAERTVATHMQALLAKLGASSRTEAAALARARGLIDAD